MTCHSEEPKGDEESRSALISMRGSRLPREQSEIPRSARNDTVTGARFDTVTGAWNDTVTGAWNDTVTGARNDT